MKGGGGGRGVQSRGSNRRQVISKLNTRPDEILSHTMYKLDGFRQSTPSQDRQLIVLIGKSQQQVHNFVVELTFQKHAINTLCEIRSRGMGMGVSVGRPLHN